MRVEDDLWQAAKVAAADQGTTVSEVIRKALRQFVAGGDVPPWFERRVVGADGAVTYEVRIAGRTVRYHVDTSGALRANDNDVV